MPCECHPDSVTLFENVTFNVTQVVEVCHITFMCVHVLECLLVNTTVLPVREKTILFEDDICLATGGPAGRPSHWKFNVWLLSLSISPLYNDSYRLADSRNALGNPPWGI